LSFVKVNYTNNNITTDLYASLKDPVNFQTSQPVIKKYFTDFNRVANADLLLDRIRSNASLHAK
jgi:hypothetical protein